MTERLGECWECEEQQVPVFAEDPEISRTCCKNCIQTCVFCGKYCDTYACANDEGDRDFDVHDCLIGGQITCNDSAVRKVECKYRYCLSCTEKCPTCNVDIVIKNSGHCKDCRNDKQKIGRLVNPYHSGDQ